MKKEKKNRIESENILRLLNGKIIILFESGWSQKYFLL